MKLDFKAKALELAGFYNKGWADSDAVDAIESALREVAAAAYEDAAKNCLSNGMVVGRSDYRNSFGNKTAEIVMTMQNQCGEVFLAKAASIRRGE